MSDSDKTEQKSVRLHSDSEHTRENPMEVKCPHCGTWNSSHDVVVNGCECGATATTWMRFSQPEESGGETDG